MTRISMLCMAVLLSALVSASFAAHAAPKRERTGSKKNESSIAVGGQGGFSAGSANISNPTYYPGPRNGFAVGGFVEFEVTDIFFIQPELNYVQKGAETSVTLSDTITTKYLLNYIELPIYAKFKYPDYMFKPFAFFGPNLGILASATYQQTRSGGTTVFESDVRSTFQNFNVSLDFGLGGEYPMTDVLDILGSARYSLGLGDVTTTKEDWKNTAFLVLGGVKYNF